MESKVKRAQMVERLKRNGDGVPVSELEVYAGALARGERGLHRLPEHLTAEEQAWVRRRAMETLSGARLEHMGSYSLDTDQAATRNCENFIGAVQVPVGVVGPLPVRGEAMDGQVHVPLATTEAALVASTNRGCSAVRAAGGATVRVEEVGMTRAPVFRTRGVDESREFVRWVEAHTEEMAAIASNTSRYVRLLDVRPCLFGTTVFLRFRFSTGDAMGMNMATIATDRIVREFIEPRAGIPCVALSGNYCVDKKPASINFHEGRGMRVMAEVILSPEVLRTKLKTSAEAMVEVQYRKNLQGSIASGASAYNAHIANLLAALFIATGQDPAHVVEGAMGVTTVELADRESLHFSIYLPDLPLGAVGGGTELATQREALDLLGVRPSPDQPGQAVRRLAEICGAVVLAGELSLMAAFTTQDLARAHERLRRSARPAREGAGVRGD